MHRVLFALGCVGLVGCSVDVDNLFGSAGAGGGTGSGGAGSQTSTTGDTTTTTGDTGAGTGGGTTTTGTTTSTTTSSTTTSTTTGGNTDPQVWCNGAACAPGDVCCFNKFEAGQDACGAPGTCPTGDPWITITCNDAADCGTGECCGTFDQQQGGWVQVQCKQNCTGNDIVMCFDDPGACDAGQQCSASQFLGDGYAYCGGG